MNPILRWERLREKEITEGGNNPSVCIMGSEDYDAFCGAVDATLGSGGMRFAPFGSADRVDYQGVRLLRSRANKRGIMFA